MGLTAHFFGRIAGEGFWRGGREALFGRSLEKFAKLKVIWLPVRTPFQVFGGFGELA